MSTTSNPTTAECSKFETTDLQVSANIANAVKLLIGMLQDGTIPVKNSARLQNLTIDDIVKLATSKIVIPDIRNHIVTNENNEITNVIEQITNYNIIKDTKFVTSDYIKFKFTDIGTELAPNKFIEFHLPKDLYNQDRIVAIYLTTKNDEILNFIGNDVLFDYKIVKDSNDNQNRYLVTVPANKLELGQFEFIGVNNLPTDPSKWGTYGVEKFIKVTYLVDANWTAIPSDPDPTLGNYDIAKNVATPAIPMTFGMAPNTDNIPQDTISIKQNSTRLISFAAANAVSDFNKYEILPFSTRSISQDPLLTPIEQEKYNRFINEVSRLISQKRNDPDNPIVTERTSFNSVEPRWIIAPIAVAETIFDTPTVEFLKNTDRVINQATSGVINNIIDNIGIYNNQYASHYGENANELIQILVPPANKVITPIINRVQNISKNETPYYMSGTPNKIINEIINRVINTSATEYYPSSYGLNPNEGTIILKMMTEPADNSIKIKKYYVPDWIIEEVINKIVSLDILYKNKHSVNFIVEYAQCLQVTLNFTRLLNNPSKVINIINSMITIFNKQHNASSHPVWVIEPNLEAIKANPLAIPSGTYKRGLNIIRIIEILKTIVAEYKTLHKVNFTNSNKVISQPFRNEALGIHGEFNYPMYPGIFDKTKSAKVIKPLIIWPATMVVSSGSVAYLQDIANMKMVSSLAMDEEFIPFYTGEDNIQRSTYEFIATTGQRVFDIATNPYDTTVYREGIRLSRGDYYVNGYKVILKSPANAGETITVVSERRYTYSNTVSKEELENAIGSLKADRPILSYPALVYELGTAEIIIENYNPGCIYDIAVKFEGTYRDDIAFVRNGDIIYLDIPEIVNARRASIDLIIYATLPGRIQSIPTTASIQIKNLYDYNIGDTIKRYVVGATPTEWLGQSGVVNTSFQTILTNQSQYTVIPGDTNGPTRIGIVPKSYIQSKLITLDETGFGGAYLDSYVGLENLNSIGLQVLSSNGSETIFSNPNFTQTEIEEAFANNTLWFIVDGSTENNLSSDFLNAINGPTFGVGTYGKNIRYNFRPAKEFMTQIHLLPRTTDTIFLEHIDKLKNRIIRNAIILDLELRADYDFSTFASIPEQGDTIKTLEIPMESIEYNVQDEVPHLLIKINNTDIPSINNPYINSESKIEIKLATEVLNTKQYNDKNKPLLQVNNLYSERIFSGLRKDMKSSNDDLPLNKFAKFKRFDLGAGYQTNYKNDYFVLEDEDFCTTNVLGQKELYLGMIRYQSAWPNKIDNITFRSRLKSFDPIVPKPRAIRSLVNKNPELYGPNSPYSTDFTLVQYGGLSEYLDGSGKVQNVIDNTITFQNIYIKDSFDIVNSTNPVSDLLSADGFHVINGQQKTIRWSTIWDTIYRPSLRTNKANELQALWTMIRDNQRDPNDQRWMNLTDGILCRGTTEIDTSELIGSEKFRDLEVINNEDGDGFLIFGGIGYKPVIKNITNDWVVQADITAMAKDGHPDAAALQNVYNRRKDDRYVYRNVWNPDKNTYEYKWVDTGGWYKRTDRLNTRYGWENGEPYIEFSWAHTTYWYEYRSAGADIPHYDVQFVVDRVTRSKIINHSIYYVDTTQFIDSTYTLDNNKASHEHNLFRKINPPGYTDIYKVASTGSYTTSPASSLKPIFYDIIKEGNAFWLTIKQAGENTTKLFKLTFSSYPSLAAGGSWTHVKDLFSDNDIKTAVGRIKAKWTMTKDGTTTLRGDGPILIKHISNSDETANVNTIEGGVYYYDTWDKNLYKKVETPINAGTVVTCIPEIPDIRNPYFLAIDSSKIQNYRIDIVGTRIYLVVYLDKFISGLTREQFNMFKENIIHLQKGEASAVAVNPNKTFKVIPNDFVIGIRTIIPDNDNYRSNSAQIIFNRMETQTGRPAENLVFRLTNTSNRTIELDSVRFVTK